MVNWRTEVVREFGTYTQIYNHILYLYSIPLDIISDG